MKLPKKITPCPIIDVNVDIRFKSALPADAVFGVIYKDIKSEYPEVEKLPILQIPDEIRAKDPNLKFQPYYKLSNETFLLQLGPRILALGSDIEYIGWKDYFPKLMETLLLINKLEIVKQVIRLGIRYINFFDFDIFEKINLKIIHGEEKLKSQRTMLTADIQDGKFINLLRVANKATVQRRKSKEKLFGSIIDIDTNIEKPIEDFFNQMEFLLQQGHEAEKRLFYSLLKPEFLETLNPEY